MHFPCPNLRGALGTESDSPFRSSGIPFSFYLQVRILNARFLTAAYLGVIKNLCKAGTVIEQKVKPGSYSTTDHRGECRIQPTTMSSREGSICYYFALLPPPPRRRPQGNFFGAPAWTRRPGLLSPTMEKTSMVFLLLTYSTCKHLLHF